MRESKTETNFCNYVQSLGYLRPIKLHTRGWNDRVIFLEKGYCFFIEFKANKHRFGKRTGEKLQKYRHEQLDLHGFNTYVCDDLQTAFEILDFEIKVSKGIKKLQRPLL